MKSSLILDKTKDKEEAIFGEEIQLKEQSPIAYTKERMKRYIE
ncbi:MAG: hypothetical protein ACMUEM_02570 [Flavobacteriales bacterium AspAUS03]